MAHPSEVLQEVLQAVLPVVPQVEPRAELRGEPWAGHQVEHLPWGEAWSPSSRPLERMPGVPEKIEVGPRPEGPRARAAPAATRLQQPLCRPLAHPLPAGSPYFVSSTPVGPCPCRGLHDPPAHPAREHAAVQEETNRGPTRGNGQRGAPGRI